MNLNIERTHLLKALSHAQGVVEKRNTIPILFNVCLRTTNNSLIITTTDLDISMSIKVDAQIISPGNTTTPAHTLHEIVRKLPDGSQITLEFDSSTQTLGITSGQSAFTLPCLPFEDFPVISENDLPMRFTIAQADIKRLIEKTQFAISTEETRYYMNGIFLHATIENNTGVLRAVATDGHRLAQADIPTPEGAGALKGVIIPRKTVIELRKLLSESEGNVDIALSDVKAQFQIDNAILNSKFIDGSFPDYTLVIPEKTEQVMNINARKLVAAVDRVSTITTDKSRTIKLAISENTISISAISQENGSGQETLSISYDGDPIEIGFNSRYLMDVATQIEGESAQFKFSGATRPTLIKDINDESILYVIMPMRV